MYNDMPSTNTTKKEIVGSYKQKKIVTFSSNLEEVLSDKDVIEGSSSQDGVSSVQKLSKSETDAATGTVKASDTENPMKIQELKI